MFLIFNKQSFLSLLTNKPPTKDSELKQWIMFTSYWYVDILGGVTLIGL